MRFPSFVPIQYTTVPPYVIQFSFRLRHWEILRVILLCAQGLNILRTRFFASLRMTATDMRCPFMGGLMPALGLPIFRSKQHNIKVYILCFLGMILKAIYINLL